MTDWSLGEYERTAEQLEPAAATVVDALAPQRGERVLDVACGTGNAALRIAAAGAEVLGVDLAPRLVAVARERAAQEGMSRARFVEGDATALPVEDDAFDAAVSVFGVIFAEPAPAAAELVRVVRPGGRIVVTAWAPEGPTSTMGTIVREALGAPPQPPRWSDPDFVRQLFAPRQVAVADARIAFTAPSVDAYVDDMTRHHPMALAAAPALRAKGVEGEVLARTREIFAEANEDPAAFRTTSRYFVFRVDV